MTRMAMSGRRAVMMGLGSLGAAGLAGCAVQRGGAPPLVPLRMQADRITRITVCLRPFRAAGPRLDVETVAGKRVVHNYGHGGSGWSLAWGSSTIAARNALEGGTRDVAVIGCGALGLTSAVLLQRAGAKVTIYAKERLPETRSARATGTWSPDSRIAEVGKVAPSFPALWEEMARTSYATYQTYVGLPGEPVLLTDRYVLWDANESGQPASPPSPDAIHFASYGNRLADLVPPYHALAADENPFPGTAARRGTSMEFNITALGQRLTNDFLRAGGRIVIMTFGTPADLARLTEPVVVNCTGYGARALWQDESITPVRGQIAWLAPQPDARYGLFYRQVLVLARPDGIVVQQVGESDMYGYGVADETPDRQEADAAVATIADLYKQAPSNA